MSIQRIGLGTETHKTSSTTWTTTKSFTLTAGQQLIVLTGGSNTVVSRVVWGQYSLGRDDYQMGGALGTSAWSIIAPRPGTAPLTITSVGAQLAKVVSVHAVRVTGGTVQIVGRDLTKWAFGGGTTPDSGLSGTTAEDDELLVGVVLTDGPVEDLAGTWELDVPHVAQRDGTTGGTDRTLSDADEPDAPAGTYRAKKTAITSRNWLAGLLAYSTTEYAHELVYHLMTEPPYGLTQLYGHTAAYYPPDQEIIVYGGREEYEYPNKARTWSFKLGVWSEYVTAHTPCAQADCRLTYDPERGVLWLTCPGATYLEVYKWVGHDWILQAPGTKPTKRAQHQQWWDPVSKRVIVWSGNPSKTDMWAWDGTIWVQLTPIGAPTARYNCGVCHNYTTGKTMLIGGTYLSAINETWEWDSLTCTFTQLAPAHSYNVVGDSGCLWYEDGTVWWCGDATSGAADAQTRIGRWTGTDWELPTIYNDPSISAVGGSLNYLHGRPLARGNHACAYNATEDRTHVFFGSNTYGSNGAYNTWELAHHPLSQEFTITPDIIRDAGGDAIAISGNFPTGTVSVVIHDPVGDTDYYCYGGQQDNNYECASDGTSISCVTPPLPHGTGYTVSVVSNGTIVAFGAGPTVIEDVHRGETYDCRKTWPMFYLTGDRSMDM